MRRLFLVLSLLVACSPGFAREAAPTAADVAVEKRMVAISEELRCLVCQNQTIADSNAPLAVDLRRQTRAMISEGKSDDEIVAHRSLVHIERMDKHSVWVGITGPDGEDVHVDLRAHKGKLRMSVR